MEEGFMIAFKNQQCLLSYSDGTNFDTFWGSDDLYYLSVSSSLQLTINAGRDNTGYIDNHILVLEASNKTTASIDPKHLEEGTKSIQPKIKTVKIKKLATGNSLWTIHKEILGWIVYGMACTIKLPVGKLKSLLQIIKSTLRQWHFSCGKFQSLLGKLQHAATAIPAGRSILAPCWRMWTG